jgi:hypothetical protein
VDLNHRPLGYEPNELPDCSTPQEKHNTVAQTQGPNRLVSARIKESNALGQRINHAQEIQRSDKHLSRWLAPQAPPNS